MGAGILKRSVAIAGHRTSISLEEPFWAALKELAGRDSLSVQALIGRIDAERGEQNLSSAIRVFVLASLRNAPPPTPPGSSPIPPEGEAAARRRGG
jgi:predicted DNA-binding ribbon-helix-helix protein